MADWYALLNAGFHVVATGNSDSHKPSYHEAGVPRNMIELGVDAPGALAEPALVDALRKGKSSVCSGPFVRIEVGGKTMGDTVAPGEAEITVHVDAPPWVEVDRIDIVKRGKTIRTFPVVTKGSVTQRLRESLVTGDWVIAIARGSKSMDAYVPGALPFGFTNPVFVQ